MSLLIKNGFIVTMNKSRNIFKDGAIAIEGNKIADVGKSHDLEKKYRAETVIDAKGKVIIPGLINTHTHLFQVLLKGLGDDMTLEKWARDMTLPCAKELTEEDCYLAAQVGCIDAIESGTTSILDFMYAHPKPNLSDQIIKVFQETGIRGFYGRGFCDREERDVHIPPELIQDTDKALDDCERLIKKYHGSADGRISVWVTPNVIWYVSKEGFEKSKILANECGTRLTVHVAETPYYNKNSMKRFGMRELEFLERIDFLGSEVLAVHCVHLNDRDISILKGRDVKVSHNPVSNMYIASGIAPIPKMLDAGITVGLATDGAASNNNQDMIETLKFTALLHKVATRDPTAITAEKILEMATIDGARALGLESEIGSIEPNKKADLVILNFKNPRAVPVHNPISTLVYSASSTSLIQ